MNVEQLLRPEELSDEELIRILTFLDVAVSFNYPRSYLLDVFKRVALPLPQRQKSSAIDTAKLTNSSETKSFSELDSFKSVNQEQMPITRIVDNAKKIKLIDSCHCISYPEAMDESIDENIPQVNSFGDSKRENSKRKLCGDFADHMKRIKITP